MALTPEDVVNKRFQQTKFREGYDQDEVDDFLDEIVVELRRLVTENEDLRRALDEALAGQTPGGQPAQQQPDVAEIQRLNQAIAELERQNHELQGEVSSARGEIERLRSQPEAPAQPAAFGLAQGAPALPGQAVDDPATPENEAESSNSLLLLARRLHDEHVAEGTRRAEELVREGEERARSIVNDAETSARNITNEGESRARKLVADAEERERETIGRLEEQKQRLEGRIEELRLFEREYRNKLRGFIEGHLNDLNRQSANVEPQGPVGQQQ